MKIGGSVTTAPFVDVTRGTAFYFKQGDQPSIGMKIWREQEEVCAVLSGHSQLPGRPGIYSNNYITPKRLLLLPDLLFVPSDDSSAYHFDGNVDDESAGLLLLNGDRKILVVATGGGGTTLVDLATGEFGVDLPSRSIACSKWSLVQIVFEEPHVLYSHGD